MVGLSPEKGPRLKSEDLFSILEIAVGSKHVRASKNDHLAWELTSLERIGCGDRHGILRHQIPSQTSQWNLPLERARAVGQVSP
jgi:hypothetical protein